MYNLPMPVSTIRTRIRQEFERQRYVAKLQVADVLLFKSHAEYQEMMNFWKQTTHVMSYFKEENFRGDKRLPSSFMEGFLQVGKRRLGTGIPGDDFFLLTNLDRDATRERCFGQQKNECFRTYISIRTPPHPPLEQGLFFSFLAQRLDTVVSLHIL